VSKLRIEEDESRSVRGSDCLGLLPAHNDAPVHDAVLSSPITMLGLRHRRSRHQIGSFLYKGNIAFTMTHT